MSWLSRLGAPLADQLFGADTATLNLQPQIEAWTDRSHLEGVVFEDITGLPSPFIGRSQAMRVPAVSRSRHLTAGTIAKLPLEVLRGADLVPDQPYWAYGTDGQLGDFTATQCHQYGLSADSPWWRMLWTVDDHLFNGLSLWLITRFAAEDASGRRLPLRMARVPFSLWQIHEGRVVDQDAQPFPTDSVVLIPGPHEGILQFGRDTIAAAASLERTAADVARRPFRIEAHQTSGAELNPKERREITTEIRAALADNNGVLFSNQALELKDHRLDSTELLIGGRNAAALDIARHASIPAAMIDASTEGSSLEYSTLTGRNQQWIDYGLSLYMDAITARLGMDDIVPAGQRVAFDVADITATTGAPTGAPTAD